MSAPAPVRLVTIPISRYCEKARWALDRAGIAYREERHVHAFAALAAPALVPPEYAIALPQPDELPQVMAAGVRAFRAHPDGAFACRLFRDER